MAISIDYSTFVITIPKADLLVVQTTPSEIRQLNIDLFRTELGQNQASVDGMPFPRNHVHTAPLTISGVTLSRVVEVLAPYTITFEDGLYNVNIVGGNSNIADRVNKNQVGVNTANSAGLQDPFALQSGAFGGEVTIDVVGGLTGTAFPVGTNSFPSSNLADALSIAVSRGIGTFKVVGNLTLTSGDYSNGYIFRGDGPETASITLQSAANLTNCTFKEVTISGVMDGNNAIRECEVNAITMFQGSIHNSGITGPVALAPGNTTELINCYSEVAGGGPGAFPYIDMGGATGSDLLIRNWSGGLGIKNLNNAGAEASIDMLSGRVTVDSDVVAGSISIRGIADVTDNSTGTAAISDDTLTRNAATGGIR